MYFPFKTDINQFPLDKKIIKKLSSNSFSNRFCLGRLCTFPSYSVKPSACSNLCCIKILCSVMANASVQLFHFQYKWASTLLKNEPLLFWRAVLYCKMKKSFTWIKSYFTDCLNIRYNYSMVLNVIWPNPGWQCDLMDVSTAPFSWKSGKYKLKYKMPHGN